MPRIYPSFIECKSSVLYSQQPNSRPSLDRTRLIQFTTSHPICLRRILILSSYLHLSLAHCFVLPGFQPKPCMHFYSPHACHMLWPFHLSRTDRLNNIPQTNLYFNQHDKSDVQCNQIIHLKAINFKKF